MQNAEVFIEKIADLAECLLGVEGFEQVLHSWQSTVY